ncbi:microfibrillar-associated protein 1 [Phlebotomus argentipes]|uniref:microfibrillar-associated protein 1 n=1 Tax=Phlebotomus argentipes TaxID=94469 RepID=UPI002892E66A|nr:microfibrillar-associated protein 1 [Phlebotomus argentipes]XP_059608317.1 microfibrillar-associated protein 1 [Phlebotomus argentipes]
MSAIAAGLNPIQSTAGAIPVRNEKGEISMQKVKVQRYISGKRPEYAYESSGEESDEGDFMDNRRSVPEARPIDAFESSGSAIKYTSTEINDPRLRRVHAAASEPKERRRHYSESEESEEEAVQEEQDPRSQVMSGSSDSESDAELSDTEIERRRQTLRKRMLQQQKEEEILQFEEEKAESSGSESYESETESEDMEDNEPRLKPLFVRKRDRTTIIEREKEANQERQAEYEAKKNQKQRRRQTLKLVEESIKSDLAKPKSDKQEPSLEDVCTDDENDEIEYEAWKLREIKRIKRDREEREQIERERLEIERMRGMTEEERKQELRQNPRQVTNKTSKGKYKFLQKYYHRGAFYLDQEEDVLKRDFSNATLEDHFDKTILPKVMQVKNFGRCGRTKYTHLVDQDTTQFDSPWYSDSTTNVKFHTERAAASRQVFEKPSLSKRKKFD